MEMFCNHWDSGCCDEWIPNIKHAKEFFSKESQKKYQVEETIIQGLTNDILSMIDKYFQADEYKYGPIYGDSEILIE